MRYLPYINVIIAYAVLTYAAFKNEGQEAIIAIGYFLVSAWFIFYLEKRNDKPNSNS